MILLKILVLGTLIRTTSSQVVHTEEDFYTIESNIDLTPHETFCHQILLSIANIQQNKLFTMKSKPLLKKITKILSTRTLNLLFTINKLGIEETELIKNITGGEVKQVQDLTTSTTTEKTSTSTLHNVYKHHMNKLDQL